MENRIHQFSREVTSAYFTRNIVETSYGFQYYKRKEIYHCVTKGPVPDNIFGTIYTLPENKTDEKWYSIKEVAINIQDALTDKMYDNPKKFRKLLSRVNRHIECTPTCASDMQELRLVHDKWVEDKLNDPKTFKMLFSTNRYIRCAEFSFQNPDEYYLLTLRHDGKIYGFRALTKNGPTLFALALCTDHEVPNGGRLGQLATLQWLRDNSSAIEVNTGGTQFSSRTASVKHSFPHEVLTFIQLNRKRETNELVFL